MHSGGTDFTAGALSPLSRGECVATDVAKNTNPHRESGAYNLHVEPKGEALCRFVVTKFPRLEEPDDAIGEVEVPNGIA